MLIVNIYQCLLSIFTKQRLPIPCAQIIADNNSEILLNEIMQIIYSLYQSKKITKKLYNKIIRSIKV